MLVKVHNVDVSREVKTTPFRMTHESRSILAQWLQDHIMPDEFLDHLPKLGLMVWHCNTPVGVAFLRVVEGGKGMIDGFLTDSNIHPDIRTPCLDQLILDLIKLAKFNDMNGIFGLTVNKRVIARAKKLGFSLMEHKLVSLKTTYESRGGMQ